MGISFRVGREEGSYLISFSRMLRYSICPRSASSPIGPVSGTFRLSVSSSPLQVRVRDRSFHHHHDFVPVLRLVLLQFLVRSRDEVIREPGLVGRE